MATKPQLVDEFQTLIDEKDLEPGGSNALSALAMFEEREYYKIAIYPSKYEAPTPFDLWYNRPMFGKLDRTGNPVFPFKAHMKQVVSSNPNVWVFDFVADAFRDFQAEFLFVNERGVAGTPFEFLNPERGWSSTIVDYDSYMDTVYNEFVDYVTTNNKDSEIVNFDKFMNLFYDFVNTQSPKIPITISQYIVSPICPPTISGLMFDISLDMHGNDVDKYNHFINNENFICYAKTAQKFGFKIDKNFPGRLIADINSPVMNRTGDPKVPPSQGGQGYMRKYPKKPKKFTRKPPSEPQLRHVPEPTPLSNQNPFENGDKISILIAHKPGTNDSSPTKWLILSDFSELKQRHKAAGTTQKIISENGAMKKGLETLKIKLHSLGYNAPQRVEGKILTVHGRMEGDIACQLVVCDSQEQSDAGECGLVCEEVSGPNVPPEHVMNVRFSNRAFRQKPLQFADKRYNSGGDPGVEELAAERMVESTMGQVGSSAYTRPKIGDIVQTITLENALNNESNDGVEYKLMTTTINYSNPPRSEPGVQLEIPPDAAHLTSRALPIQLQRFIRRTSYPVKLQKYQEEKDAAELRYNLDWNEWSNVTKPKYEAAKLASKQAWQYYENPFNQLTANNMFDKRYRKSYLEDIYILKEICMQFYYSYTSNNPVATVTKLVRTGGDVFLTEVKVIEREQISQNLINQKYPQSYWIKQYLLIRNAELETKKTFDELRLIRRRALNVYEKEGLTETLKYIKEKLPAKAYKSVMNLRD